MSAKMSASYYMLIISVCLSLLIACSSASTQRQQPSHEPRNYADNLVTSAKASIPQRIYECIRDFSLLRCTKLFVLQKLEERRQFPHSGNITRDFMEQFFGDEEQMSSLVTRKYVGMSEKELNQRLVVNFQRFFKHRNIKLHFLPGIMIKIVANRDNKLKFSLKKKTSASKTSDYFFAGRSATKIEEAMLDESSSADPVNSMTGDMKKTGLMDGGVGGGGVGGEGIGPVGPKRKRQKGSSYKSTILQFAVPVMVMPAILMGSFLPFVLPMLKLATIMTMMLNNSAFIAALIYAARTHVNAQDDQQAISYGHPGYH